ncbi:MAG: histidine phosphatase family protein [Nitriliruptorales bacterium]|nr:histidine phosphatase family protein [Nitriliruptorales bacterium]
MQLILVRHGQPGWATDDGAAVFDPGLKSIGRRQADAVAERLAGWEEPIDELYVSTATRARETAAPVADRLGLEPKVEEWLHEIRLPEHWDGTPAEEVGRVLREARVRPRDEWWDGLADGESFRDFHHRVTTGLGAALTSWGVTRHNDDPEHLWHVAREDQRIAIVAHAGTNSVVIGYLLGLEPQPWEWERFASDHASVTVLQTAPIASGWIWGLQRFSDVAHHADGDVTI